ncbi:MAG: ParB N-terminal domain-containing protein [Lachnospiraceae bacterium]|nr:ParB N-terminal domain-containing protein [Lachnospiraceae bacterium]
MGFNIKDFLNEESKKELAEDFHVKKISVKKLHPSKKNFYQIDPTEIMTLKDTIELVGIQENLIVREITEGEYQGEYEIIAGHKRHLAVSELVKEGKITEYVPCRIDHSGNGTLRELILIFTNSTQRERSDYEKMHEIQRVRELLKDYAGEKALPGRKRDIIAEILNTSKSTIARLDNIRRHIIPEFMEEYKAGKIPTATANEIAGISGEKQKELWQWYQKAGSLKSGDVAAVKQEKKLELESENETQTGLPEDAGQTEQDEEQKDQPDQREGHIMQQDGTEEAEEKKEAEKEPEPESEEPKTEPEITIHKMADYTDRKNLIIDGKINWEKEYSGMKAGYFIDAVTNSDLFDAGFWGEWQRTDRTKEDILMDYAGIITDFCSSTGEACTCELKDRFTVKREEEGQESSITMQELIELLQALLYTGVIEIKREKEEIAYWGKETTRELARLVMWLTENELAVLQDIVLKLKERAGK